MRYRPGFQLELKIPAGYRSLTPLSRDKHRGEGAPNGERYAFAAELNAISLTCAEYFKAARHYPIVFSPDGESGTFVSVVLTSLRPDTNLFVRADGGWRANTYVPAYVRRYPLFAATVRSAEPETRLVVFVDESGLEANDRPFFDDAGEPTTEWQRRQLLINDMEAARLVTVEFLASLQRLELLEPFEVHALPAGGARERMGGLYRVGEDRLNALAGGEIKQLMSLGHLSRIYAHLMSLENFAALLDLAAAGSAGETGPGLESARV